MFAADMQMLEDALQAIYRILVHVAGDPIAFLEVMELCAQERMHDFESIVRSYARLVIQIKHIGGYAPGGGAAAATRCDAEAEGEGSSCRSRASGSAVGSSERDGS